MVLLAAACAYRGPPPPNAPGSISAVNERTIDLRLLTFYDTDADHALSRAELENGMKRDFAVADRNRDGSLDAMETDAENQRRWRVEGPAASPIMDWNQDGFVDFVEYAATARTLFNQLDRDHDGVLDPGELRLPVRRVVPAGGDGRGRGGGPDGGGRGG